MYLVVRPSIVDRVSRFRTFLPLSPDLLTGARRADKPTHLRQILRRVDAERIVFRFDRLDAYAVFQRTELLECLGPLEGRGLERGEHHQRIPAVRVKTD